MSKNRYAVTCNGRPAFYASMYEDIRELAISLGWAVALHGSLKADMDIMAMPWVDNAVEFETLISAICGLFEDNQLAQQYSIDYINKPHGRIVATIPIWDDFYLDISTTDIRKPIQNILKRFESKIVENPDACLMNYRSAYYEAIEIVKREGGEA